VAHSFLAALSLAISCSTTKGQELAPSFLEKTPEVKADHVEVHPNSKEKG